MLVINFREDTGQTIDLEIAIGAVNEALRLEVSQDEIQRLLDEADATEENVSRDTTEKEAIQ